MAVNYTNLFTALGELLQRINAFSVLFATLDGYATQIETDFQGLGYDHLTTDLYSLRDGWKSNVLSWINGLKGKATGLFTDRVTILEQLELGDGSSITVVLPELIQDMLGAQTVEASAVAIGASTDFLFHTTDAGDLLLDKVLDGYAAPVSGGAANVAYNGVNSELALTSDNMFIECISDSEGLESEGAEVWQWSGRPKKTDPYNWQTPGSGTGPTIVTLNSNALILNGEFELFTSDVPNSWTIVAGAAAVNIDDETVLANVQRGSKALKFIGSGAVSIKISQEIDATLIPKARYCFAIWVKGDATVAAGALTIQFEGTDYTAGVTEKITMDAAALAAAGAYTLKFFYINMPAEIPDDFAITIAVTGTLTTAAIVRFDGLAFGLVSYFNGINAVIIAGHKKFIKGDKYTFAVTNNDFGVFQKFFRDAYLVQLPSHAAPSIADTLATDA